MERGRKAKMSDEGKKFSFERMRRNKENE